MKAFARIFLILSLLLLVPFSCTSKRDLLDQLQKKAPPEPFTPPQVTTRTLANGLKLYLLEDPSLPILEVKVQIQTGPIYDPAEKIGLAKITSEVLRTGGTSKHQGDQIDRILADRAITIGTSSKYDISSVTLTCLISEADFALKTLFEIIRQPVFEKSKLDLAKQKAKEQIRRRNDSPNKIIFREFKRIVWGTTSPWARISLPSDIDRISRSDLINFYRHYFVPNNMALVAVGDFETESFITKIEKLTSGWGTKNVKLPLIKIPTDEEVIKRPHLYLIPKDFTQSTIIMGHLGPKRHCPDEYAIAIMNMILGESTFVSRIGKEVRTNLGLAYVVWSYFIENRDLGLFISGAMTKSSSTIQAITTIKQIISQMYTKPKITDQELYSAKETIRNTFIFKYESKFDIARRRALLDYHGYRPDYLDTYLERIDEITANDVEEAAKKYLDPENLFILVIGNKDEVEEQLKELGMGEPITLKIE